jgi:hypothetical protein
MVMIEEGVVIAFKHTWIVSLIDRLLLVKRSMRLHSWFLDRQETSSLIALILMHLVFPCRHTLQVHMLDAH